MTTHDLLIEIGTEELPPKHLHTLARAFATHIQAELTKHKLTFGETKLLYTPRRIALRIDHVLATQATHVVEKRGPTLKAAYDTQGNPTLACIGFANTCGVTLDELTIKETDQGAWVFFTQSKAGQATRTLLPDITTAALSRLPIPKPMRWGRHTTQFIRPVHWVVLMLDETLVPARILGQKTVKHTYGHRFHHPDRLALAHARDYEMMLREHGYVVADPIERQQLITQQVTDLAKQHKAEAILDEELLEEVVNLVEWPIALLGKFDQEFLALPPELITTCLKHHQKSFSLTQKASTTLLPHFITISNIESKNPSQVINGNERVIRARLADAAFFYQTDLKHSLAEHLEKANHVIFHKKLGSLFDKANRIAALAAYLAEQLDLSSYADIAQAGLLSKGDLMTGMVAEFPELQGIMGYYYARHDGLSNTIASAIKSHYQPRFSGDALPNTTEGALVSIADKIDTLTGLFGIDQPPTGEKDPFALRRAALGVLRILIEKRLPVDLLALLHISVEQHGNQVTNPHTEQQVFAFMMERLRAWYIDKGTAPEIIAAVLAKSPTQPLDLHTRIQAVQHFQTLPEAKALAMANKRVSHILKDQKQKWIDITALNAVLSESSSEQTLIALTLAKTEEVNPLYQAGQYTEVLTALASLQTPIDRFFDDVMVMTEDETLRHHRLSLLYQLQQLFLQVADVSLLVTHGQ